MRTHHTTLKAGIQQAKEFEKKRLASFSVNIGVKCSHDCKYCSTGAMLRMHPAFKEAGESPFSFGYTILDPDTPERVRKDAKRIRKRGLVQLCTTVDAWAPEAHTYRLGRRCLEAILEEPGWSIRILTKSALIRDDFDLIEKYRDRVLVGLSITAPPHKSRIMEVLEPNASPVTERILTAIEASVQGFRTYAMFCPLLPGIADSPYEIDRLVKLATDFRAEEIFAEPVNPRGPGLRLCQEALENAGYRQEAAAIEKIRRKTRWSEYVLNLLRNVQKSVRRHSDISRLRFLLYPTGLLNKDDERIQEDSEGVIRLEKAKAKLSSIKNAHSTK